ncbi:hypothetical protein Tco_0949524 [Tanacetum coccineum]
MVTGIMGLLSFYSSLLLLVRSDKRLVLRQVFREWGSKNGSGRVLSFSHKNKGSRAQTLCENECKRVRSVRQWIESSTQQAETGQSVIEEQALEIGSRKSIRMLFGRHDLLDLLKSFEIGRRVVIFSYKGWSYQLITLKGLKKGFLSRADSDDQIHDERHSDSSSNNGMGCHRENFQELPNDTVDEESHDEPQSDTTSNNGMNYHQENSQELPDDIADESQTIITRNNAGGADKIDSSTEILPQTETVESSRQYHDGSDDRSRQTHHFNLSQQTLELESDYDTAELRELSNRRRVSNLLQNGFGLRLDELLRSHVERQEQASQSEQQESVFENDGVSQAVQSAKGALSSPPAIPQLSRTERDIINGLRIDMVRLQEQMNSLQSTLETCMKMQHELQRSVQQEVWSALSRLSTLGDDIHKREYQLGRLILSIKLTNRELYTDEYSGAKDESNGDVTIIDDVGDFAVGLKVSES